MMTPADAAVGFRDLLKEACRRVEAPWFYLPYNDLTTSAKAHSYRERVYCYELYHQVRCLQDAPVGTSAGSPDYRPSGEIDKRGLHAVIKDGGHKPDLVWHVPGELSNAVVVEVKRAENPDLDGVRKDIDTLISFLTAGERAYDSGILLFFGPAGSVKLRALALNAAKTCEQRDLLSRDLRRRITVLHHEHVGEPENGRVRSLGDLVPRRVAASPTPVV